MALLWHINLKEMLGDLTVATFLILLAVSIVVIGSMVTFPLIDLAFQKKVTDLHHEELTSDDAAWQAGQPWLILRSNLLRQHALSHSQPATEHGAGILRLFTAAGADALRHTSTLIRRTKTARPNNAELILAASGGEPDYPPTTNAAPVTGVNQAA